MNDIPSAPYRIKNAWVFCMLFLITIALYLPAAKAGWVIDGVGFIYNLRHQAFWDFINRTQSEDKSFYQLLTLQYFIGYKLWGMNVWLWSLLYMTLQAVNAFLLFILCKNIFDDSAVKNGTLIALCGAILFAICPHVSEVVICKAYYHYLQSFVFILLIMIWVQKYQRNQQGKYILGAFVAFILSVFTLEIFYLIPFLVLSIAVYYRFVLIYDRSVFRKTILYFFGVQVTMLLAYFIALYLRYKFFQPHKIEFNQSVIGYLSKPLKYLFHILFLGRFFSAEQKNKVYVICESVTVLFVFYTVVIVLAGYLIIRLKQLANEGKVMLLLFALSMMTLAFLAPLPFPDASLLVFYDRYSYFADGFVYTLLALLAFRFTNRYVALSLLLIFGCVNLWFTIRVNTLWKHSAYVTNRLIYDLPPAGNKTIVLLNVPENMQGAPMIGAQPLSKYRDIFEVFRDSTMTNNIYDAASYNMLTMNDGAHVTVINDSVIHVTLNQWGTWWWYEGHGGKSYENEYYRLNMTDPGHRYELTLKHPADQYLLLYEVGPEWRVVDMRKKNVEQN